MVIVKGITIFVYFKFKAAIVDKKLRCHLMKVYEFQLRAVLNWLYTLFTIKNYDLFKKWPYSREKYWPSESLVNSFYRNHWPVKSWLLIITHRHGVPLETPAFRVNSKFRNISLEWCRRGRGRGGGTTEPPYWSGPSIIIDPVINYWLQPSPSILPLPPFLLSPRPIPINQWTMQSLEPLELSEIPANCIALCMPRYILPNLFYRVFIPFPPFYPPHWQQY